MKQKIFFTIAILSLLSLAVFVTAMDGRMTHNNDFSYDVEVDVVKGWNILTGIMPADDIAIDSEIKSSDIKAVWYWNPELNKYMQVYPEFEGNIQAFNAMWVYSDKSGRLKYTTTAKYTSLSDRALKNGYNFISITPDMYSGVLDGAGYDYEFFIWDKITENCNLESVYAWNPETQDWIVVESDFNFGEEINDLIGMGMVVKVSNSCNLNEPIEETIQPPQLP